MCQHGQELDSGDRWVGPEIVVGSDAGSSDCHAGLGDIPNGIQGSDETMRPMRRPLPLAGTLAAGYAMGVAEVVPGFSGGTVALVAGIYERLIANIRSGAHALSLLLRGKPSAALRAVFSIDWLFIGFLLAGMASALVTVSSGLRALINERPVEMSAIFLGLVLGASVLAARRLRQPSPLHALLGTASTAAFFVLLGFTSGSVPDPTLMLVFAGGAVAICAWILPGVSGAFLLLVLGLFTTVLDALADVDLPVLSVFALGCVVGLAIFSTLLNWALSSSMTPCSPF